VLDGTALPPTLIVDATIPGQAPCTDVVASLSVLPGFPPTQSADPLLALCEKAAHEFVRERKEAIDQAAELLKRGDYREEVLALLEYLAQHDEMISVREKAQELLKADAQKTPPPPRFLNPNDARHTIGVRCQKCGQVSYFDKRRICSAQSQVVRGTIQRGGKELDEMDLPCEHCPHIIPTSVDCEGYKVRTRK